MARRVVWIDEAQDSLRHLSVSFGASEASSLVAFYHSCDLIPTCEYRNVL